MLGLPKSTEVNRRIPKQKFYENLTISPTLKRVFVEKIKVIWWRNIDHVKGMDTVLVVKVDVVVDVAQDKDHTFRVFFCCGDNRMEPLWLFRHIAVCLNVVQQIKAELIQTQIHNGNARGHILHIHHFLLEPLQLLFSVFQIALFFLVDQLLMEKRLLRG